MDSTTQPNLINIWLIIIKMWSDWLRGVNVLWASYMGVKPGVMMTYLAASGSMNPCLGSKKTLLSQITTFIGGFYLSRDIMARVPHRLYFSNQCSKDSSQTQQSSDWEGSTYWSNWIDQYVVSMTCKLTFTPIY